MISKIFLLLDVGPVGTGIGLFAAVAFFLVCAVVAFAAFLLLKKTLKMAFRVGIVIVLLVIAVVGGIAFVWFGYKADTGRRPRPPVVRPR